MLRAGLVIAIVLAGGAAARAQEAPAPSIDPLDPASCTSDDGRTRVAIEWSNAWYAADKAGRFDKKLATELAVWRVAMDNWLIESNEVQRWCELLIETRKRHGF